MRDGVLGTRAEHFSEFVANLRERLNERNIEPSDDTLVNVACQLYAIEDDESEIYPDDEDDADEDEETDW